MKQNKYDNEQLFTAYGQMTRSIRGLEGAGEWHIFKNMLPDLREASVLDLGCGYGWHCRYAREQQASSVIGVDISEKMLAKAKQLTDDTEVTYIRSAIEDVEFADAQFDVVISSLALHYVESYAEVCKKVYRYLKPGGVFVFSVEHPVFTARREQDWHYDEHGNRLHWPLDHYQHEGQRDTSFLVEHVIKYHRTISTYINELIRAGFMIQEVQEPVPPEHMLHSTPEMIDEWRRPMFLIISARKPHAEQGSR
jgi:SAM-dependent methyltransferase